MNIVKKYWKRVVAILAIAFMIAALVIPGVVKNSLAEETSKNYYYYNGTVLLTTLHAIENATNGNDYYGSPDTFAVSTNTLSYYRSRTNTKSANIDNHLADFSNSSVLGVYKVAMPSLRDSASNQVTKFRTQVDGDNATAIEGWDGNLVESNFADYKLNSGISNTKITYEGLCNVVFGFISAASVDGGFIDSSVKDIAGYTIDGYYLYDFVYAYLRPDLFSTTADADLLKKVSSYAASGVGSKTPKFSLVNNSIANIPTAQSGNYDYYGPYYVKTENAKIVDGTKMKVTSVTGGDTSESAQIAVKNGDSFSNLTSGELSMTGNISQAFYICVPKGTDNSYSINVSMKNYKEHLLFKQTVQGDAQRIYCAIPCMEEVTSTANVTIGQLGFKGKLKVNVYDEITGELIKDPASIQVVRNTDAGTTQIATQSTDKGVTTVNGISYGDYTVRVLSVPSKYFGNGNTLADGSTVDYTQDVKVIKSGTTTVNILLKRVQQLVKFGIYCTDGTTPANEGQIKVTNIDTKEVFILNCNAQGKASVTLPYGDYLAEQTIAPYGYENAAAVEFGVRASGISNMTSGANFTKNPAENDEHYQFIDKLYKKGINVKVIDASGGEDNGRLVDGAIIKVFKVDTDTGKLGDVAINETIVTDGELTLDKLPVGTYAIKMTSSPEYYLLNDNLYYFYITQDENATETVTIPITRSSAVIQYIALDENGNALKGVSITLDGKLVNESTDNSGTIYMSGMKAGTKHTVKVKAVPMGYVLSDGVEHEVTLKDNCAVEVVTDQFRKAVGKIGITLTDSENANLGLAGATFTVKYEDGTFSNYVTDDEGKIEVLAPAGGYKVYEKYAPEGYDISDKVYDFEIASTGSEKVCLYSNVKQTADVSVKVTGVDSTGIVVDTPIGGAKFKLYNAADDKLVSGVNTYTTSATGSFVIKGLGLGNYYLLQTTSDSNGYYSFDNEKKIAFNVVNAKPISVDVVNYIKYGNIYFRYLDEDTGNGVEGATFTLYTAEGKVVSSFVSNAKGQVMFANVPYGEGYYIMMTDAAEGYELYKGKIGSGFTQKTFMASAFESALNMFGVVTAHAAGDSSITVNDSTISINGGTEFDGTQGTKSNSSTNSGSDSTVTYSDGNTNTTKTTEASNSSTGSDSSKSNTSANNNSSSSSNSDSDSKSSSKTTEDDSTVVSAKKIKGDITVTVLDKNGTPVAGVTVGAYKSGTTAGTATTNTSGVASFSQMPYGTYTISVVSDGYAGSSANVTVAKSGGTYTATITVYSGISSKTSTTEAAKTTESVSVVVSSSNASSDASSDAETLNTGKGVDTLNTGKDVETLNTGKGGAKGYGSSSSVTAPKTGLDGVPTPVKAFGIITLLGIIAGVLNKFKLI